MKTLTYIIIIWATLNITALTINLLLSNLITGTITLLALFATGAWILAKGIKL